MIVYPESPVPQQSIIREQTFRTNITTFKSGKEQRQILDRFPRRTVKNIYEVLYESEEDTLWNFYCNRRGQGLAFLWFNGKARTDKDEYVGRGAGSQLIFDLPSKETVSGSAVVYVDNVPTAVTLLTGGGDGGSDRVQFSAAPGLGTLVTADFNGKLRLKVRFVNGSMSEEQFNGLLYKTGLDVIEVR